MKSIKKSDIAKLDNPVWNSLIENHSEYCIQIGDSKFYDPDYCPFGAFKNENINSAFLQQYSVWSDNFYIVGKKPFTHPDILYLKNHLICNQMIASETIKIEFKDDIIPLTTNHQKELIELINLVQPGYFKAKTFKLGDYYGIFNSNQLVAVTGERMKMINATEISAVVTHPEHVGKGYAKQLVAYATNKILNEKKLPFLHVTEKNIGAIRLYKQSGFKTRRKISFWHYENLTPNEKERKVLHK